MQKTFIVTGANGHLGNTIVKRLLKDDSCEVRCLVLADDVSNALQGENCKIFFGDVTCKPSLHDIFDVTDNSETIVIHCAAIVSIASAYNKKVFDVNVNGTKNVADLCLEKGFKMIYVSSVHAIPEGKKGSVIREVTKFDKNRVKGLYAKTKAEAAQYVLDLTEKGLNACVLHPSGIIGPNDFGRGHLTQLVVDFLSYRLSACVKGGYDFVDVRDVADAAIAASHKGKSGECFILSGQYAAIRDLLDVLSDVTGRKKMKTVLPMWIAKTTAPLAELYYKCLKQSPLFTSYSLHTLCSNACFCNEKAKKALDFNPRPIKETLADTAAWLHEHGRIKAKSKRKLGRNVADDGE